MSQVDGFLVSNTTRPAVASRWNRAAVTSGAQLAAGWDRFSLQVLSVRIEASRIETDFYSFSLQGGGGTAFNWRSMVVPFK